MQNKTIKKILISSIIILLIIMNVNFSNAAQVTPDKIDGKGNYGTIDVEFINNTTKFISIIGTFLAVGVLMVIGIKYVTGSVEEKANYKKTMIPYLIRMFSIIWSIIFSSRNKRNCFRTK